MQNANDCHDCVEEKICFLSQAKKQDFGFCLQIVKMPSKYSPQTPRAPLLSELYFDIIKRLKI